MFDSYDQIFLIGGDKFYREVFEGFNNSKLYYIKSNNQADLKIKAKKLIEGNSPSEIFSLAFRRRIEE